MERSEYLRLKEEYAFARKNANLLAKELELIKRSFEKNRIGLEEFTHLMNVQEAGKTKLQWLDHYDDTIEEKQPLVIAYQATQRSRAVPATLAIILLIMAASLLISRPASVGYIIKEVISTDTLNINKSLDSSSLWFGQDGMTSVKISGYYQYGAEAKIYLSDKENSLLLFDSSLEDGFNLMNISDDPTEDSLRLSYGSAYDVDGVQTIDGIIDIDVEADGDYSCTLWEIKSLDTNGSSVICYGQEACCSYHQLKPLSNIWNDSLYLNYNAYGASYNNLVSVNLWSINLSSENPYIRNSPKVNISAQFIPDKIPFTEACAETCSLANSGKGPFSLDMETNGEIFISSITYTTLQQVPNHAPSFNLIPSQRLEPGQLVTINLSQYTLDEDNDTLIYSASETDNLTILITQDIATIMPDAGFTGKQYLFFTANDSTALATSNTIEVNIVKSSS